MVQAEYTYRWVNIYTSDEPWFKEVMFRSSRPDDTQFSQPGSGDWHIKADNRLQLPAVIVEVVPKRSFAGKALGGGSIMKQDVLFHVLAEQPYERNKLADIISFQFNKTIYLFDRNAINTAEAFPLDRYGSIASGAMVYPDLVDPANGYFWKKTFFQDMRVQEITGEPPLFRAVIRATMQTEFGEI